MERITEKEDRFVKSFANFVNGEMSSAYATGHAMANVHRFLVNEEFKVVLVFIEQFAYNYKSFQYDARNAYACRLSAAIIEELELKGLYYSPLSHKED